MKILLVISSFYPAWSYGGPGNLVYEIARSLTVKNQSVTVYSTDAYDAKRRRGAKDDIQLMREKFSYIFFRNLHNGFVYYTKFFLSPGMFFRALFQLKKFDIIHIHEIFTPNVALVALVARIYKIPYFFSAHGTLDPEHLKHRGFLKKIFLFFAYRIIFEYSSGFVAATDEEAEEYRLMGVKRKKIVTVNNGIDIKPYLHLPRPGKFRDKFQIPEHRKIIIYLGRIHKLKGLDLLVRSFKQLSGKLNCRLVIAGSDDGYLPDLKKLVRRLKIDDRVIFPGVMSGSSKLALYRDAQLFVYPSPAEGFSLAVLEGAAAGLPLVITRGCKFKAVSEYKAGLIVPFAEKSFTRAILKIFSK